MRAILVTAAVAVLLFFAFGGTMSKAETQYICSPMSGTVIGADGAPAAGVTVRRDWRHNKDSGSDQTTTDGSGNFAFDAVPGPRKRWFSGLSTPVIDQRYFATIGGQEVQIMFLTSTSLSPLHETDGKPFNVTCKLGGESRVGNMGRGFCTLN